MLTDPLHCCDARAAAHHTKAVDAAWAGFQYVQYATKSAACQLLGERIVTTMTCQQAYTPKGLPIVLMEDPIIHTADNPFCSDPGCPCHESPELMAEVAQKIEQGLLTPAEATRLVQGQQV